MSTDSRSGVLPLCAGVTPSFCAARASAISNGFFALAIAVLTKTPSQPNSIAIVASDADDAAVAAGTRRDGRGGDG